MGKKATVHHSPYTDRFDELTAQIEDVKQKVETARQTLLDLQELLRELNGRHAEMHDWDVGKIHPPSG